MEDNKSITGSQNRQILPVQFVDDIKQIVEYGLREAYDGANSILVKTYWNVGRRIVEEEQSGKERAEYGIHLIDLLSHELSLIYPKGYSPRNLRDYRLFYLSFQRFRDLALASAKSHVDPLPYSAFSDQR